MNVAALQQQFRSIAQIAESAGASPKTVAELGAVAEALAPFEKLTVAQFALFLRAADEFVREGTLPKVPGKKAPAKPKATKVKADAVPPEEIVERVFRLYETIVHTTLTEEAIATELKLVEQLKKPGLQALAEKLNIWQANKKLGVPLLKAKIQEEVRERKNRYERSDY